MLDTSAEYTVQTVKYSWIVSEFIVSNTVTRELYEIEMPICVYFIFQLFMHIKIFY